MKKQRKEQGFTLIELLIIIALMLSILGIAIVSFINISNKKKEEAWQLVKEQIETAATEYLTVNEYLFEGLTGDLTGYISVGKLVEEDYLNKVTDPRNNKVVSNKTYVEIKRDNDKIVCKYNESENNRDINQNEYVIYVSEVGALKISALMTNSSSEEELKINNGWYNKETAPDGVPFELEIGESINDYDDVAKDSTSTNQIVKNNNSIETEIKPFLSSGPNLKIYESINGGNKQDITEAIGYDGVSTSYIRNVNIQGKNTVTYTVTKNGKSSSYTTDYKLDNIAPSINSFNVTGDVALSQDFAYEKYINIDSKGFILSSSSHPFPNEINSIEKFFLHDISSKVGDCLIKENYPYIINESKNWFYGGYKKIHSDENCKIVNINNIKGKQNNESDSDSYIVAMRLFKSGYINWETWYKILYNVGIRKLYYRKISDYNGKIVNISGDINDGESGIESKEITYSINGSSNENNYFASIEPYKISEKEKESIRKQINATVGGKVNYDLLKYANSDKVELISFYKENMMSQSCNKIATNGSTVYLDNKFMYADINYYKKYDNCGNLYSLFKKNDNVETMRNKVADRIINNFTMMHKEEDKEIEIINNLIDNYEGRDFKQKDIYTDKNAFPDSGYFELNTLKVNIPIDKNENKIKFKLKLKDKAGNVSEREFVYNTYVSCRSENTQSKTETSISNYKDYVGDCTCECTGAQHLKTCKVNSTDTTTTYDAKSGYTCSTSSAPSVSDVSVSCPACPVVTDPNIEVEEENENTIFDDDVSEDD